METASSTVQEQLYLQTATESTVSSLIFYVIPVSMLTLIYSCEGQDIHIQTGRHS